LTFFITVLLHIMHINYFKHFVFSVNFAADITISNC